MTFFTDRCLGVYAVPEALRSIGAHVEVHDDHFDSAVDDPTWMQFVGEKKWIGITKDKRIRHHPRERAAAIEARGYFFFLAAGNLSGEQQAETIVRHVPAIVRLATGAPPPQIGLMQLTEFRVFDIPTSEWVSVRESIARAKAARMKG